MRKSVFVMDGIVEKCVECRFWESRYSMYCTLKEDENGITDPEEKPEWCPLRPLPERKGHTTPISNYDVQKNIFARGWNTCLDEIVGENDG